MVESPSQLVDDTTHSNPLSAEGVSFIRTQLDNCLSNPAHDCDPLALDDRARWPARVLRICDRSVILLDFDADVMSGQFAALSYCWGTPSELKSNPPYKATASTIQTLRSGLDVSELPITIQQALLVCKELEIGYIWIDSLCIIQDSLADWEVEATKMATVYSMSKVTIIAASSTSCHSGFLDVERRHDRLRASLDSPFQLTVSSVCTSGFHKHKSVGHPHDPLDTRGWTFQEEVLSSRYIKFTKDDIQWKCNAGSACICGREPSNAYRGLWQVSSPTSLDERSWESLVEEFSHRLFTKDTDKLVSLSSLARKMASRFPALDGQTPYVAGLWRHTLVQQLKWYAAGELGRCFDNYVAPSFSWASLGFYRRGVEFSLPSKHVLCEAIDASTTPVYQGNQFGAVSRGTVTLYGPHIYCTIRFEEKKPKMFIRQEMTPALEVEHIILDCPLRKHVVDDNRVTLQRSTGATQQEDGEFSVSVLILGQSGQRPFRSLYCLILGYRENGEHQRLGQVFLGYVDREAEFSAEDFKPWRREVVIV
ncbi:hypothetical protein CEP51_012771 [Fusarium floridanum]|uniref:Heterokaryon incompatibility domain-containing protein n=1 Tax=Fusarium floridanum TaxID=1325733 RepID=A0A428QN30_9HYPO|nr:hypothetical protein CEP51_012771 [Fusarium floridanum]